MFLGNWGEFELHNNFYEVIMSKNNPKKIDNKYEFIIFLFRYHFWKIIIIFFIIMFFVSMIINVGYDKAKGGFYWKPADISIKKGIKNE
jgi:hypothetical protein